MFTSSALYSLEDDWTDIVEGHANLSEQLKYSITYILQFSRFSFMWLELLWQDFVNICIGKLDNSCMSWMIVI